MAQLAVNAQEKFVKVKAALEGALAELPAAEVAMDKAQVRGKGAGAGQPGRQPGRGLNIAQEQHVQLRFEI